ncbi:MAG: hypothetical protein V1492_03895 [Candidatus Micrarchaeota archaeon]
MEFDELLITTGVDALVKIVKLNGRIELSVCAEELNLPSDTLEEWARILEEEGILKVEYKLAKVFLVWVQPAEEEIEEERKEFAAEKKSALKQVETARADIAPEMEKVIELQKSFSTVYDKLYKRLGEMEKSLSPVLVSKGESEKRYGDSLKRVADVTARLEQLRSEVVKLQAEMKNKVAVVSGAESEKSFAKIKKSQDELFSMMSELKELKRAMETTTETKAQMPSAFELKKKYDSLAKDFADVRNRNSSLREDLISIKEGTEIVTTVSGSLNDYVKNTSTLKKELAELSSQADTLFEKVRDVDARVKESFDTIGRFSDSLETAKGIVTRFPSQEKIREEVEDLRSKEKDIEDKLNALKKILELAGGTKVSAAEAEELMERIDGKVRELKEESLSVSESLEEEKNQFLAFQQVRDRVVPSIRNYQLEIDKLEKELLEIKKMAALEQTDIREDAKKATEKMGKGEVQKLSEMAAEIKEKKKLLDDISSSVSELVETAENLNRRLSLLSSQAKLIEIRAAPSAEGGKGKKEAVAEEEQAKEAYVKEQLKLTKEEEKEFVKKREELKKLITKLWEEDSKPSKKKG